MRHCVVETSMSIDVCTCTTSAGSLKQALQGPCMERMLIEVRLNLKGACCSKEASLLLCRKNSSGRMALPRLMLCSLYGGVGAFNATALKMPLSNGCWGNVGGSRWPRACAVLLGSQSWVHCNNKIMMNSNSMHAAIRIAVEPSALTYQSILART